MRISRCAAARPHAGAIRPASCAAHRPGNNNMHYSEVNVCACHGLPRFAVMHHVQAPAHTRAFMEKPKIEIYSNTIRIDERLQQRRAEAGAPASGMLGPGSMLGHYLIIDQIGEGGMGVVYRAQDTVLDRMVALKVLPPHLLQNPDFLRRIRNEAMAQARLQHPNIITLYSVLELPIGFVLVMEYVAGQTLQQRLQGSGALDPGEAVWIFEQALQGLSYAHQKGIVHRDLKPDNIFLTDKQGVKIMDFGVARIVDSREVTRSRSVVGTLLYISPEQINGRSADFRSDIYTLGITLFEAVTGRLPFERKSDYALMHAHVLETPPSPRNIKRNLSHEIEKVILRAIEKNPEKRYQTADEFRTSLLRQAERSGLEWTPARNTASPLSRRFAGHNRILGGIGFDLFLIAAIALLALMLGLYPGRERPRDEITPVTHLTPRDRQAAQPPANRTASGHQKSPNRYDSLRKAWGG